MELTVVECPMGCGGTSRSRHLPAPKLNPDARSSPVASQPFTDAELADALRNAGSVREAIAKLGSNHVVVKRRITGSPNLRALYLAARERGRRLRPRPDGGGG
jgi:hypothetical protein